MGSAVAMERDRSALDEARRLLAECPLFRGLTGAERNVLVARAHLRKVDAGDTIFLMDSPGDSMMAILEGNVRISVPSPEGKEIVLAILQPGEVFGEIALLDGKGRTADARGLTACSIAILDRRAGSLVLGLLVHLVVEAQRPGLDDHVAGLEPFADADEPGVLRRPGIAGGAAQGR